MKVRSGFLKHGSERARSPGSPAGRWRPVQPGAEPLAARDRRRARRRWGVKVPPVEPFTRPVLREAAQDVLDAPLAQVDTDEMA